MPTTNNHLAITIILLKVVNIFNSNLRALAILVLL